MWFTGKLRASVKANNLHLKCKNGSYGVASNKISDKAPSEMPNATPLSQSLSKSTVYTRPVYRLDQSTNGQSSIVIESTRNTTDVAALAATAPGLATQRHLAPASGSAPGSRPGAQLPLGDGPLSRSYRQLGSDLTRRKCTACALLPASSVLQSGGYRCHPHHRRNGICSSPIAGFV